MNEYQSTDLAFAEKFQKGLHYVIILQERFAEEQIFLQ